MKKTYLLWSVLAIMMVSLMGVSLTSCGPDPDPDMVSVDLPTVNFPENGGTQFVPVKSNTNWTVSGNPAWLTVSPTSGSGNGSVTLTALSCTEKNGRNCVLYISAGSASTVINVSQTGVNPFYLPGTTWEDAHHYSNGTTFVQRLEFTTSTARLSFISTEGTSSTTDFVDYNYTQPGGNNIVVMNPLEAGKAVIEGRIDESGAKITLTNTSNGSEVAVLYKK